MWRTLSKTERCPICSVPVKPENLLHHIDVTHPKHPDAAAVRDQVREDVRYAPPRAPAAGFRFRKAYVVAIVGVVLVGFGIWYFDPARSFSIESCLSSEQVPYHIHPFLRVVTQGNQVPIPWNTGIVGSCHKPLHTHDGEYDPLTQPARIHVESPVAREFTLGNFFTIWGRPFTPTQVVDCVASGSTVIRMTVNGAPSSAFGALVLQDGQQIAITCGP